VKELEIDNDSLRTNQGVKSPEYQAEQEQNEPWPNQNSEGKQFEDSANNYDNEF
jgi:hypothetical protein